MLKKFASIAICLLVFVSCTPSMQNSKVRIGINPWPGYEFLYLAQQQGMFAKNGLNIEIVELSSLADAQRIYTRGRIDGFGSTVVGAVQVAGNTQTPLSIVLVPDFSYGGDGIMAHTSIKGMSDLKGKVVGVEMGSLGMYILYYALAKYSMTLDDVDIVYLKQFDVESALLGRTVDAVIFPFYSIELSNYPNYKKIFDTSEIPKKVIDVISLRKTVLEEQPQWVEKFHNTWRQALLFAKNNQRQAYEIMAKREGISVEEFTHALDGLRLVEHGKQRQLLRSVELKDNIRNVCDVLKRSGSIQFDCLNINNLIEGYDGY